jgi:hypothetical protein
MASHCSSSLALEEVGYKTLLQFHQIDHHCWKTMNLKALPHLKKVRVLHLPDLVFVSGFALSILLFFLSCLNQI